MSNFSTGYHKWLAGENRTDGWRSQWRIDLERRMAEDALKPRPFVRAKQIKERQEKKKYPRQHPNKFYFKRECSVCGTKIRHDNKTGRCIAHKLERPQPLETAYECGACDKPIRKTILGICKKCYTKYRRRIEQKNPRCAECGVVIRLSTKYGLCRLHSGPMHSKRDALRRKMQRAELKKAA